MAEFQSRSVIEPFRIKTVEPLPRLSRSERIEALKRAKFNLFKLKSSEVLVDLLTDSGTSAMSALQWAALQRGDESYAGSTSFLELQELVQELTGYPHVIPTHQGRAAERILFKVLAAKSSVQKGKVPSNGHFDTTRANLESLGYEAVDLPSTEFYRSNHQARFKGNMDIERLEQFLQDHGKQSVPFGMLTITNNSCGGQPVSLENIKKVSDLYRQYDIPFFLDACRFAENAAFICRDEYQQMKPWDCARQIFSLADGCSFSGKKDALVNIGGFIATRKDSLLEALTQELILTEGFPTYGGLAGRDLAAMAQGLREVLDPSYLEYRLAVTQYMSSALQRLEIPHLQPAGGHALYLDAGKICSHLKWSDYPGQALALSLYCEGGLRSSEIGSLMFGRQLDGSEKAYPFELVRLAIPRRVYTQSHMDYCIELIAYVVEHAKRIPPVKILKQSPQLRHFSAEFSW